jgi:hypothetical protein
VNEKICPGNVDSGASETILDSARQIVRRRQRLAARNFSLVVDGHQISKRSTYVNSDSHESLRIRLPLHTD